MRRSTRHHAAAPAFPLRPLVRCLREAVRGHWPLLLMAGLAAGGGAQAQLAPNALPVPAPRWLQSGTAASLTQAGSAMRVQLSDPATVLNWNSLDVGASSSLTFAMPSSTARVLNNVQGGAIANRTTIDGALRANGQVYIYNPNGIVFGPGSTVNVDSLVASTLRIDSSRFLAGLLSPDVAANLAMDPALGRAPGSVVLQSDTSGGALRQAAITAARNGLVLLAAPQVDNQGVVRAPDGQVVLAAGSKVYLAAPTDPAMRGLRVEVSSDGLAALGAQAAAVNSGTLAVERGNITMAGFAVRQDGVASATTSVNLNGSIYLLARDGASKASTNSVAVATHGGNLTLGAGSSTTVQPTLDDATSAQVPPAGQAFKPSQVELSGGTIRLAEGARVVAPAGVVNVSARANPGDTSTSSAAANGSSIELAPGSLIDVSGTTSTVLPVSANVVSAELRGTELADNLLLRDSALRGSTVRFDLRKAPNGLAIANVQGYINLVEQNVGQQTAAGGSVSLRSEGRVDLQAGSRVDVSGGQVSYTGGTVETTKLTLGGRLYDIETAPANLPYDGAVLVRSSEAGFVQGRSAGTVQVSAPDLQLGGTLAARTVAGPAQRDLGAATTPVGGTLLIGNVGTSTMDAGTGRASLGAQDQFVLARDIAVNTAAPGALRVDTAALTAQGFTRVEAVTTGSIRVGAGTTVAPAGRLWLGSTGAIDVQGDVQGAGASVTLTSADTVRLAPGATVDLAGRWQNDSAAANPSRDAQGRPDGQVAAAGGALRMYGHRVDIGAGATVDVSAGAWMNSAGKSTAGTAGSIVLQASPLTGPLDASLHLGDGVRLLGYGFSRGGALSLTGRNVVIGAAGGTGTADDLFLDPDFFARGGFASRSITATGNLTVADGVTLAPRSQTWQLNPDAARRASGRMDAVASVVLLPLAGVQGARPASSLTLRAGSLPDPAVGTLSLGTGATIDADPGASVTLSADRQVRIDGTVNAPAGTITAAVQTTPVDPAAGDGSGFGVWLGPNARLLARGTGERVVVDAGGVSSGEVLDGGTVRIGRVNAGVTEANTGRVVVEQGALIDVSGAVRDGMVLRSGSAVQPPVSVASAGGTIEIKAQGGLQVAGRLAGAGGDASAHGGSLLLGLDSEGTSTAPVVLTVSAAEPAAVLPAGTSAGQRLAAADGTGVVSTASLARGGFANVRLKSQDTLVLAGAGADGSGSLAVKAGASLALDAPNIDAANASLNVQLQAPLVSLGNSDVRYQDGARAASSGQASLSVQSRVASLVGTSATHGFGEVRIAAREDLRLSGTAGQDSFGSSGSFATGSHLVLSAAQVYPDTLTAFSLSANGSRSLLEILPSGTAPGQEPLSAAGRVLATADTIVQAGVLRAPFGSITLQAGSALRYEAGSLTSVAASTAVPFGNVVNGSGWTYTIGSNTVTYSANPSASADAAQQALPAREIVSRAPAVTQAAGAMLDLGGGGKLSAYEFTPGPGGSSDVLQSSGGTANRTFAILPGYTGALAPSDAEFGSDGLRAGDQVWLSGFQGLPAGYYTLLPAHYALQAGGYLVEPVSGSRDMGARDNRSNADGSLTVAGYRASALDGLRDARSQGFRLYDGALVRRRSEFKEYDATAFFAAQAGQAGVQRPAGPADGGHAVFDVTRSLDLAGTTRLQADAGVTGARRGTVDVAAPGLDVTASRTAPASDRVQVLADQLTALQADSLLLGGLRRSGGAGAQPVQVVADSVRIANDAAHPLAASEVVLAARDTVQLATRSSVRATTPMSGTAQTLALDAGSGNGAVLRAGGSSGADVVRPAFDGRQGRLEIQPGASVAAGGSLLLDATGSMALDAMPTVASGSDIVLRAPALALGSPAAATPGAAQLDAGALQALGRAGTLELTSYTDMDVWGTVRLGSSSTRSLKLGAATLRARGAADMRVSADRIVLTGGGAAADPARDAATASLRIEAADLQLGGGSLRVQGFGQTLLRSAGALGTGAGGGAVTADNNLTVDAVRIAAASGADLQLSAGDALVTRFTGAPVRLGAAPAGGSVLLSGRTVRSGTDVAAPSGRITLQATEGLQVSGGVLDAHGATTVFAGTSVTAPAGSVLLDGGNGDVRLDAPARIDVSAASGSAGSLSVRANGRAGASLQLDGAIAGSSGGSADDAATRQGSFSLDVAALSDPAALDALNTRLNGAGFTESRSLRVRSGDVRLGAATVVRARDIAITVDDGNLSVAGMLDARGGAGGSITLSAGQSVATGDAGRLSLEGTARLLASATTAATSAAGSTGDGGRVLLSAANADGNAARRADGGASVRAASGALIDVSGAGLGQGGSLVVRAPRVGDGAGTDVAVADFGARVAGASDARIEAVKVYQAATISDRADSATNLNAGLGGRMASDADRFMAAAPAVRQRLGREDLQLTSGIEVRSAGDLEVSVNEGALDRGDRGWNLSTWRFGGQAGTLTLRAGGNLSVRGTISDGFVRTGATDAAPAWRLDSSTVGWSLRLVGGSDFGSAQVLGVRPATGSGDVTLGFGRSGSDGDVPVSVVRTGTGRIDIAAGRDVVLARTSFTTVDGDTVQSGAQLYTAGRAVQPDGGFTAPLNAVNPATSTAGGVTGAQFGTGGGGISIEAQRSVQGPAIPQLVNNWLFRQGRSGIDANGNRVFDTDGNGGTTNTAWWVRPDWFSQGVATFGGGDISVVARQGNVTDLSANVATSAWMPGSAPDAAALREQGGGNLRVQAGGSIQGGSYYAQKGDIRLQAGRDVSAGTLKVQDLLASTTDTDVSTALRPVIAIGDGRIDVTAGRNLAIETVYNPTLARQGLGNVDSGLAYDSAFLDFDNLSPAALAYRRAYAQYGAFSTYGAGNSVRLIAAGGDAQLSNNTLLAANAGGAAQPLSDYGRNLAQLLSLYPGSLQVVAPQGSVRIDAGMALAPSATGQLDLLAGKDVHLGSNDVLYPGTVMLDSDPSRLLSASQPGVLRQSDLSLLRGTASGLSAHTPGGLHAQDTQPVKVVALQGDVSGTAGVAASLIVPKAVSVVAGQDIRDLGLTVQHGSDSAVSVLQAGRDIIDTTNLTVAGPVRHTVGGGGLAVFSAGRNVDLGNAQGIVTRGNLDNPYLAEGGASVMVEAGVQATRANLTDPAATAAANATLATTLFAQSKQALDQAATQAAAAGVSLNSPAGIAIRDKALADFDATIAAAWQTGAVGSGDIKVFGSQVKTEQGGSIDLLAPGGSVIAGLVTIPPYLNKPAADNGIFTIRGGDIRSVVRQDFTVNQGRVFTLGGGDIDLISQFGNIDAGRGSKTAASVPPPLLTTDAAGNTRIDIAGSISGSGIATLRASETKPAGNVLAAAPRGIFDAGDAGVRSSGKVEVQASVVLNAGNIAAGGGVSGSSAVTTAMAPAAPATPAAAPAVADPATTQSRAAPREALPLSVDVVCYGSDGERACKDGEDGSSGEGQRPAAAQSPAARR